MRQYPKLEEIIDSIKKSFHAWREIIVQGWLEGNRASYGFAIGDIYDTPAMALTRDGYKLIMEADDLAIGTNNINSIIAVVNIYGPWAVDITETLIKSNSVTVK